LPVVWLVDDSATERAMTRRSLGPDFSFVEFSDGVEVVERSATGALPDVLLLDWVMPGMSGDEVCRYLRSHDRTKELQIIIVTASRVETTDVVQGLAAGANDYIVRPFAPQELRARVETALRAKRLHDEAIRERTRLAAVNRLGGKLFEAGGDTQRIFEELAATLAGSICDGCSILLLPGPAPETAVARHREDPTAAAALLAMATIADPAAFVFESAEEAARVLARSYHGYIARCGLSSLAILPFPLREPFQGVITVTRDGESRPFDREDLATIETCIEYATLAVQNAMRLTAERTARTQLHAVLEHAPIGIVVTNRDGAVTLANPTASTLVPGIEGAPDLAALIRKALEEGSARQLRVASVPLMMGGAAIGEVTTLEDVTVESQLAAEKARLAAFQAQMLAIVGHDLRSPLGAIYAGAEALNHHAADSSPMRSIIRRMQSSASRMTSIVDQLLDVTRARLGGGIPIHPQAMSLTPMIRGVLDELALAHPSARFELVADEQVHGMWDSNRLAQVVSNLASNAIQYGRAGSPVVVEVSAAAPFATITVTNTVRDAPIASDRLRVLFDPYIRGAESERHVAGLGLGLYIVSEIVRAHGGTITAESSGSSTVFRVQLPLGS
jgi:signal transduction histidine kinase/CheY-like chemotaxis protein